MNSAISIVFHDDYRFPVFLDKLISETNFNPIYSPRFDPYYIETSSQNSRNFSIIVIEGNNPIFGILLCQRFEMVDRVHIDYLGRTAAIISRDVCEPESIRQSGLLLQQLFAENQQSWPFRRNILTRGSIILNNVRVTTSPVIEDIIRKSHKVETRFMRIINLEDQESVIKSNFSKSVKSALKEKRNQDLKISIVDFDSSLEDIVVAIGNLRFLHLESAGRVTRSLRSWEIQAAQIKEGNAFIVEMKSDNQVVSSAYFMNTESSCYYGVSASQKTQKRASYSHACLVRAIEYSKNCGLKFFHLGEQHSGLSRSVSEKELSIEKFKSFFGGNLTLEILFRI